MSNKKRPRIEEVYLVHHHHNNAIPALKTSRLTVLNKEGVTQNMTAILIPEEDGAFSPRTHLLEL